MYAIMEFFPNHALRNNKTWMSVKAFLLAAGILGAFTAFQTGELAEHTAGRSALVEMHRTWAMTTMLLFGVAGIVYVCAYADHFIDGWFGVQLGKYPKQKKNVLVLIRVATRLQQSALMPLLACAGLIALIITGSLGGAIVYGPDADPVVHFIYSLFF